VFADELRLNSNFANQLSAEFPEASFESRFQISPGLQRARMPTGTELRVRLPKIGVPVRFYWAVNPRIYRQYVPPVVVFDRSMFPNSATFENALTTFAPYLPYFEPRSVFRLSLGRTF